MELKNYIKDYSTYLGVILVQITLIGAGLVLMSLNTRREAVMTYTAPTKEVIETPVAKPQVTGTSTQRELTININTASQEELELLSGVGEATAKKIIDYREKTPFKNIEDIKNVSGIGEKKFEDMKPYIHI